LTKIDVRLDDDTVWLTRQQIAELFAAARTNIVEHIKRIYDEGELSQGATCRNFRQVRLEGNREVERSIPLYDSDMILSVGYRVFCPDGLFPLDACFRALLSAFKSVWPEVGIKIGFLQASVRSSFQNQQQSPLKQSQLGSLLVSQPLMIADAHPTPALTSIAFTGQFKAQAPHSMQASFIICALPLETAKTL
jgi:hypothetical protein